MRILLAVLTKLAAQYVMMPAGIVRGALSRLGLIGVVVPEISNLPQCTYASVSVLVLVHDELQLPNRYTSDKTAKAFMNRP